MKSIDQGDDWSIVWWRDLPEHSGDRNQAKIPGEVGQAPDRAAISPLAEASGQFAARLLWYKDETQARNAIRIASSNIQAVLEESAQEHNEEAAYENWIKGFCAACRSTNTLDSKLPDFYRGLQEEQRELVAWVYVLADTCKNINHLPTDIPGLEAALRELDSEPEPDHLSKFLSTLEEAIIGMLLYLAKLDIAKIR